MRRNIKVFFSILAIIVLILPITYSYAIEKNNETINEKLFFEVSSLEVSKNEKIEMTINLNEIEYNKFLIELESTQNLENVEVSEDLADNSKDLEVEKNSNEISMEIDKKTTNINTITLYYQIPEQMQVNDTIRFVATVTNLESYQTDKKDETEDELTENDKEESKLETISLQVEVKIVEKKEESNNQTEDKDNQNIINKNENKENEENKTQLTESKDKNITENLLVQSNTNNSDIKNITTISNKETEATVTYNGSNNNYLSELYVTGYKLNKEFAKDNSTYFITVENNVDSLEITASKDEDTSTVCVYGNNNLNDGINKILISVTAENGDVRNYRIYVTKN